MKKTAGFALRDRDIKIQFLNLLTEMFPTHMNNAELRNDARNKIDKIFDDVDDIIYGEITSIDAEHAAAVINAVRKAYPPHPKQPTNG